MHLPNNLSIYLTIAAACMLLLVTACSDPNQDRRLSRIRVPIMVPQPLWIPLPSSDKPASHPSIHPTCRLIAP